MNNKEEIEILSQKLDKMFNEIKHLENVIVSIGKLERFEIVMEIISKLKILISDTIKVNDLLSKYGTLRYILETLINIKLLNLEETYTFKLYYSIFLVQVEKTKKFIFWIDKEINLAKSYAERDLKETIELSNRINPKLEPEIWQEEYAKIEASIDRDSDFESVIFWGNDYKYNGYSYTANFIETHIRSKYVDKVKYLDNKLNEVITKVYNDNRINSLFSFTSESDVLDKLKEKRTNWKEKAKIVGLENDYTLIYDISSSIIHSTSYSIFTDKDLNESDNNFVETLVVRYIDNIIRELKMYLPIDNLDKIVIIETDR